MKKLHFKELFLFLFERRAPTLITVTFASFLPTGTCPMTDTLFNTTERLTALVT